MAKLTINREELEKLLNDTFSPTQKIKWDENGNAIMSVNPDVLKQKVLTDSPLHVPIILGKERETIGKYPFRYWRAVGDDKKLTATFNHDNEDSNY